MNQGNPVLVMDMSGDVFTLKIEYITDNAIPETLNGESGFHVYRVRMMTELLLRQLVEDGTVHELGEEHINAIAIASSLHDIGKSQIPKSILDYPGKLSPLEYDIVKKHSVFGENIINETDFGDIDPLIKKYAAEIARAHHERIDGTGYPDGARGDDVPISAQVVALAYSYDALTSSRSYKEAISQDAAVQMISSGMCGVFDETLLDALMKVVNHKTLVSLREKLDLRRAVVNDHGSTLPGRVLCIGNTQYLTREFIETAFSTSKVTVVGNTELDTNTKIKLFKIKKPSVQAVFDTYDFDAVVYFSGELTYDSTEKSDSEEFREVLECASEKNPDMRVLYLASLDSSLTPQTDKAVLSAAKERLCEYYAKEKSLDIKTVQIPYLYSGVDKRDFLYRIFERMHDGETVELAESATSRMYFLSMCDLAELVARIMDNWNSGSGIMTVNDDFGLTFDDLADGLTTLCDDVKFDFQGSVPSKTLAVNNKALRNEYGWFSKISILENLSEEYTRFLEARNEKTLTLFDKIKSFLARHTRIVKIIELFLLFIITEFFLHITDSAVIFSIVDFRMVYIVVMGTTHGLYFGIAASALSSVSWFFAKVASGTNPLTIFYEPTNWLAFVFFFLVGALCGYIKLKYDDKIAFVNEQNKLLEDKLVFTRELYEDTFREKRDLKKQIIGSKDSFGKIFDITRKLNTVEPHQLYLRIMDTFETVLENKNITVYSVTENSAFGRLEVASRDIIASVSRSISTDTYAPVIKELDEGEIWRNTELIPDFPMYAAGVRRGGKLVLVIFLWHADADQRSLYYVNLFKILRDLAEMSLLRAYDYNSAVHDKQYIENTHIMNKEAFDEALANFESLAERKVSLYVLLELDFGEKSYGHAEQMLIGKVRTNDILGASDNGRVRLLLSQATEKDLDFILPRFESLGITVSILH